MTADPTTTIDRPDESDPTYTHFTHRTQFLHLLNNLLRRKVDEESVGKQDDEEDGWVRGMGAIVSWSVRSGLCGMTWA
jgi:hypothetical protein